jgi:2-methylcitrate dehydratase PrpD
MAVAGRLMKLTEQQIANGLGFAGLFASGLMEATISGQQNKCIQVGNAAFNGVTAAYYAAEDLEGTVTVLEGKTGFFNAQARDVDIAKVTEGLGRDYRIADTYSKMYPTCRHSQAAIEAALDLTAENGFGWQEVKDVWVGTHQVAYDLTGVIKEPVSAAEAKFSLAYGVALALHEHGVGTSHLTPRYWEDETNKLLANKVTVVVDPEVQAVYPGKRGARVRITLADGRSFCKELYDLKGSPKKPVSWQDLVNKFKANVSSVLNDSEIDYMVEFIKKMEQPCDIREFCKILHY